MAQRSEPVGAFQLGLRCADCGLLWTDARERWSVFLTDGTPPRTVTWCPTCSLRVGADEAAPSQYVPPAIRDLGLFRARVVAAAASGPAFELPELDSNQR